VPRGWHSAAAPGRRSIAALLALRTQNCDACREALHALGEETAKRAECFASSIEDELGKGRRLARQVASAVNGWGEGDVPMPR
jgi:hypothetical protein